MSHEMLNPNPQEPSRTSDESVRNPQSEFRQSSQRLFALLDMARSPFYKVTWDESQPDRITGIATMRVVPTGARRQEHKGLFAQAQFEITEIPGNGDPASNQFIWLDTPRMPTGTRIYPNEEQLSETYDYYSLNPNNIVLMLTERARSVDDYADLIHNMKQRNIPNSQLLAERLDLTVVRIAENMRAEPPVSEEMAARQAIGQLALHKLLKSAALLGHRVDAHTQGTLLSKLLQPIVDHRNVYSNVGGHKQTQDIAAGTLEMALQNKTLTATPYSISRVCSEYPIYKYPFATQWLHAFLMREEPDPHGRKTKLFSVERAGFACGYIRTILNNTLHDSQAPAALREQVKDLVASMPLPGPKYRSTIRFDLLLEIARQLNAAEGNPSKRQPGVAGQLPPGVPVASQSSGQTRAAELQQVSGAFATILRAILHNHPRAADWPIDTCTLAVVMMLEPVIIRSRKLRVDD